MDDPVIPQPTVLERLPLIMGSTQIEQDYAMDLTAIIPTYERPALLKESISGLLASNCAPQLILVSEGSIDSQKRRDAKTIVSMFSESKVTVSLVRKPNDGRRCGNRNHLVRQVQTPFLLMIDDDCVLDPGFVNIGLELLRAGQVEIVTCTDGPLWCDFRGFWRSAQPGESAAVSLKCCMGRSDVFQRTPLDENILFGSEELDFTLRIAKSDPPARVASVNLPNLDIGIDATDHGESKERHTLQVSSRILVGIRRYWNSRSRLCFFLLIEALATLFRKQPRPKACRPGQWRSLARHLLGRPTNPI
jgi:glycosyltransferase involved in cell wall biosynthesis